MSRVDENAELRRMIAEGAESGLMSDRLAELLYIQDIGKSLAVIADSMRPTGKWIKVDPLGMGDEAYMCSECKTGDWGVTIGEYKFCPNCGAKMGVEDDERSID